MKNKIVAKILSVLLCSYILLLSGCTASFGVDVEGTPDKLRIVFHSKPTARVMGKTWKAPVIGLIVVKLDGKEPDLLNPNIIWQIESKYGSSKISHIYYGQESKKFKTIIAAQPLSDGVYMIRVRAVQFLCPPCGGYARFKVEQNKVIPF